MSITALEIQEVRFGEVKKGYDPNEVDEFLERVAADVDTLNRALSEAAVRIKTAEARADEADKRAAQAIQEAQSAQAQAAQAQAQAALEVPAVQEPDADAEEPAISHEIISKAFIAAQQSADALQEEARKEAEKVYREAEAKGRDIVREALAEKQKTLGELDRLRESCEQFRTEYLSLLKHFQSEAQKRFAAFDEGVVKPVPTKSPGIAAAGPAPSPQIASSPAAANLTAANDAAMPSARAVAEPIGAATAAATAADFLASASAAQPTPVAKTVLEDDFDLDIEEID